MDCLYRVTLLDYSLLAVDTLDFSAKTADEAIELSMITSQDAERARFAVAVEIDEQALTLAGPPVARTVDPPATSSRKLAVILHDPRAVKPR